MPADIADTITSAFLAYSTEFQRFTLQARWRFESRDWHGSQRDAAERLDTYNRLVTDCISRLSDAFGSSLHDRACWARAKRLYRGIVQGRADEEIAETFYNSVTRRVFVTVGVDPEVEFVASEVAPLDPAAADDVVDDFWCGDGLPGAVRRALRRHEFSVGFEHLERDVDRVSRAIAAGIGGLPVENLQLVRWVFFRNKEAYLVGRVVGPDGSRPVVLALLNRSGRVFVDAVLLTEDEVSIVFSFARSYFFVEAPRPAALVAFLRAIMPRKPVSELYTSIGHNRHGKTELYRDLLRYLGSTGDRFVVAPGVPGMVMTVFTMPSLDVVFKVIRDRFDPPKTTTREGVMDRYRLVFKHDRAGRLVDAQSFEHLSFARERFDDGLIEMLLRLAPGSVALADGGRSVVVRHLYTERRMTPLDIYLRTAAPDDARAAIVDYGQALRDLAATDIFPGDLLLKNFGVTRHGRLVFYDFDELCPLSECRFRRLPPGRTPDDDLAAEPWFHVSEQDVFPEEFLPFLGVPPPLRDAFLDAHRELLSPEFWWRQQEANRAGQVPDLLPYGPGARLGT